MERDVCVCVCEPISGKGRRVGDLFPRVIWKKVLLYESLVSLSTYLFAISHRLPESTHRVNINIAHHA
jgi:hypothetical protein